MNAETGTVFETGENCWRVTPASRFGWVIDAENYFLALCDALRNAEREILILGWDIDSRTQLIRDEEHPDYPCPLAETLESLVDDKPSLEVRVLSWDFAVVYMLERELLPARSFGWEDSERLHFKLDGEHPVGASHHQKVVVIDGRLAFSGGIDITKARWDTRDHAPDDDRRKDPDGHAYRPFHDVQAVVSGKAAADLRELFCERWQNATGEPLPELAPPETDSETPWPGNVEAEASDVDVAIARTWVQPDSGRDIREVERLYVDMIASARDSVYIENQYFTSPKIADALAERLDGDRPPEIVIVMPAMTSGWLEQATMDVLRNQAFAKLRKADRHGKLGIVSPVFDDLGDTAINVHGKIIVIDSRVARIGSANLSQRSMGLDTECDLAFEDAAAAARLTADLLAEHMGADIDAVESTLVDEGLFAAIDRHNGGGRRLDPLETGADDVQQAVLRPVAQIADLEKPLTRSAADTARGLANTESAAGDADEASEMATPASGWLFALLIVAILGVWIGLGVKGTGGDLDPRALLSRLRDVAAHPLAPWLAVPAFVAGSVVVAPVTAMVALCGLLFEPLIAVVTATAGVLASTVVNHWIGMRFGDVIAGRVPGAVAKRINSIASASDMWSLAGLRLIPIAPFTVVNLVAGAAGVRLKDFLLGSLVGMGPGIVLICLSVDRARAALSGEPVFEPWIVVAIAAAGLALIGLRFWQQRPR